MDTLKTIEIEDIVSKAEAALGSVSRSTVTISDLTPLSNERRRNFIARARASYQDGPIQSVILKATRSPNYNPAADDVLERSGLVREWTATALIRATAPGRGHGSALLAGDVAAGLLVFEDLGADLGSLVEPLLKGTAESAERALARYATALARLHVNTVGCLQSHHETFQSIFGRTRARPPQGWDVQRDCDVVVSRLGGEPPTTEVALLSERVRNPGPWLSLIHGDPCPDNALLVGEAIRLIDYEFARPSHALLDGIYWRIGFPTCWCAGRVPADVAKRIDVVYRMELARVIPQVSDDDLYSVEVAHVAAIWLFTSLAWRLDDALGTDATWGIWSVRGRLLWYLQAVIEMTEAKGVLPGIRASASMWLAELQRRWPDAQPLGFYPAFR